MMGRNLDTNSYSHNLQVFESKLKMSIQSSVILTVRPPVSSGLGSETTSVVICTPLTSTSDCLTVSVPGRFLK